MADRDSAILPSERFGCSTTFSGIFRALLCTAEPHCTHRERLKSKHKQVIAAVCPMNELS